MTETWHYTRRDGERCTLTYDPETGEATNPTLGIRKNIGKGKDFHHWLNMAGGINIEKE